MPCRAHSLIESQTNLSVNAARRNIVICTTSIISGDRMMDAAIEKESFARDNVKPASPSQ